MSGVDVRAFAVRDSDTIEEPRGERIPARLRRGASLVIRTIADMYAELEVASTEPPLLVTGSANGELDTALTLIEAALHDPSSLSPARFASSVHNSAAGLLGIATGNVAPTTAIASGDTTLAMALVEATALVRTERREVVVLVADAPIPSAFGAKRAITSTGFGLLLAPEGSGARIARLGDVRSIADVKPRDASPHAGWFPVDLIAALRAGSTGIVPLAEDQSRVLGVHVEGAPR